MGELNIFTVVRNGEKFFMLKFGEDVKYLKMDAAMKLANTIFTVATGVGEE